MCLPSEPTKGAGGCLAASENRLLVRMYSCLLRSNALKKKKPRAGEDGEGKLLLEGKLAHVYENVKLGLWFLRHRSPTPVWVCGDNGGEGPRQDSLQGRRP